MSRIAVCAIAKNEEPYLKEWLAFYRTIGITDIFVYDNVSDDGTSELLASLNEVGLIHRVHWPRRQNVTPQRDAYQHFLNNHAANYKWVLTVDIDEFLVPRDGNIHDFLDRVERERPDAGAVAVPWLVFGPNGRTKQSPGLVIERFLTARDQPSPPVKTLYRPECVQSMRTHVCDLLSGSYVDNTLAEPSWDPNSPIRLLDPQPGLALVHHYVTKSREEWDRRRSIGRPDRLKGVHLIPHSTFEDYLDTPASNTDALRYRDLMAPHLRQIDAALTRLATTTEGISVKLHLMDPGLILGSIEGEQASPQTRIRVLINDSVEFIIRANVKFGDSLGFRVSTNWSESKAEVVSVGVVGQRESATVKRKDVGGPIKAWHALAGKAPSAEILLFSKAVRGSRTKEGFESIRSKWDIPFKKFPWFGEFMNALHVLNSGCDKGRQGIITLGERYGDNVLRDVALQIERHDAGFVRTLLDEAGIDPATIRPYGPVSAEGES
ncbi:glycosyltransferase family 2 protein [Streptomyces sp. NPDC102360]|uniref:glycosyltransferase family 2 protein n=1 Tax=Streptomyces sp. NPDC102360 TaxID=3366160 RepID=UPI003822B609